jgi:hypothetical protein
MERHADCWSLSNHAAPEFAKIIKEVQYMNAAATRCYANTREHQQNHLQAL